MIQNWIAGQKNIQRISFKPNRIHKPTKFRIQFRINLSSISVETFKSGYIIVNWLERALFGLRIICKLQKSIFNQLL